VVEPNEDFVKRATEATPAKRAVSSNVLTMATLDDSTDQERPKSQETWWPKLMARI
jgi:hypothetical protein